MANFALKYGTMRIPSQQLLSELSQQVYQHKAAAVRWLQSDDKDLNFKRSTESWSVLECIEHLNRYGNFYIPEIGKRLEKNTTHPGAFFKSGWLGNYFAKSMLPGEAMKPMKTFASMDPAGSSLDKQVLHAFIRQQDRLLELLEQAATVNLKDTKTAISITRLIRLRLGDTFRFVIYHNHRHIVQAQRLIP